MLTLIRHKTRILWNQFAAWKGKLAGPLLMLLYLGCSLVIGGGIAEVMTQARTWFPVFFLPWITCFLLLYGLSTVFLSDLIMGHTLNWGQMSTDHRLLITLPISYPSLLLLKLYERLLTDITGVMLLFGSFLALTTGNGITFAAVCLGVFLFVQVELLIGLLVNLASVVIQRLLPPSGVANTFSLLGYLSAVVVLLPYLWFANDLPRALGTLYDLYNSWGFWLEWGLAPLLLLSRLLTTSFEWQVFLKWQGFWCACLALGMLIYTTFGHWQWLTWTHSGTTRRRQIGLHMFSGVFRKELLLLKSDFNLLTNALLLPFSIIFLEVWVFRDLIMTGRIGPAMNAMSGAIFYFCLFGPLNTVGNERGAVALLENLPLGAEQWLKEKTRFWGVIALTFFLPASVWMGYELGFDTAGIIRLSTWTILYSVTCIWVTISFSGLFANFQSKVLQQGSTLTGKMTAALCMGMLITAKSPTAHSALLWLLFLVLGFSLRRKAIEVIDARLDLERYHLPPFRPLDVWLYWLFLAGLTLTATGVLHGFTDPQVQLTMSQVVSSILAVGTLFLLSAVLVEHRNARTGLTFAEFGLKPGSGRALLEAFLILVVSAIILFSVTSDTGDLLTSLTSPGISQYLFHRPLFWVFILCIGAGGFLLPLVEETFFRGMILPALGVSGWSRIAAVILSAGAFALVQPVSFRMAALVQSLLCGMWYQRSGSILPGLFLRGGLTSLLLVRFYLAIPGR